MRPEGAALSDRSFAPTGQRASPLPGVLRPEGAPPGKATNHQAIGCFPRARESNQSPGAGKSVGVCACQGSITEQGVRNLERVEEGESGALCTGSAQRCEAVAGRAGNFGAARNAAAVDVWKAGAGGRHGGLHSRVGDLCNVVEGVSGSELHFLVFSRGEMQDKGAPELGGITENKLWEV